MKEWKKYRIKTTAEAEEAVIGCLNELGINEVEIEDNIPITEEERKALFIDILPEMTDDKTAYISFYIDAEKADDSLLKKVEAELERLREFTDIGSGEIESDITREEDWVNNWKAYFKPFQVGNVMIRPAWIEQEETQEDQISICIDPGTSFGTGMHETTQLAIRQITKYMKKGDWVLDIGCGSGILSIIALKEGASFASLIDIDPLAVDAAKSNLEMNGLTEKQFSVTPGNMLEDDNVADTLGLACFDVVVANILADVVIPLFPQALKLLKPGGVYIMSGIYMDKADEVEAAVFRNQMELVDLLYQGDWVSVVARKRYTH